MSTVDKLSKSVEKAIAEIGELRDENERLGETVADLERRLAEASAQSEQSGAWQEERDRMRDKLETLAERLENALQDD